MDTGAHHRGPAERGVEAVDEELQWLENTPASFPLHLWISVHGSLVPLISVSCLEYRDVKYIPDINHSFSQLFPH